MKLTVVYDNEASSGLRDGWGFACYIESEDMNILFDTGWDGEILLGNMFSLDINPNDVDTIIISHHHWDHIGGLPTFLSINPDVDVIVPHSFSCALKKEIQARISGKVIEIRSKRKITTNIYTTGELGVDLKEQSLILKSKQGSTILSGCSHPTLKITMTSLDDNENIFGFIGGLHDSEEFDCMDKFTFIAAGHCTKHKDVIKNIYPGIFENIFAGYVKILKQ